MAKRGGVFGFLQGALFDNLKNKGMGLFLALLVWFYAFGSTQEKQAFTPELEIKITESQLGEFALERLNVLAGTSREGLSASKPRFSILLRLEGPRKILGDISDSQLQPVLEVRNENAEYDLLESLVVEGLPQGVTVIEVEPRRLRVTLEPVETRRVPIQWENRWRGTPARRFSATPKMELRPEFLEIEGPRSAFDKADVFIEIQNLDGLGEPTVEAEVEVLVDSPDPRLRRVAGQPEKVMVRILLEDATETEDLKVDVFFAIRPEGDPVKVQADRDAVVRFRGTRADLDILKSRINDKENPFQLIYVVNQEELSGEKVFRILPSAFRWPSGVVPAGIEIVDFAEGSASYDAQLKRSEEKQQ